VWTKKLILLVALTSLASCAQTISSNCSGWGPLYAKEATVTYLNSNDPELLKGLIAHQEYGVSSNCWKK